MSIHGYVGNVITANPTAPTSSVATGVWTTEQQLIAKAAGNWPFTIPTQQISRSLRFNPADTAYLNRTLGTSNRRTFTFSAWVKRSLLASTQCIFGNINFAGGGSTNQQFFLGFSSSDQLDLLHYNNGTSNGLTSSAVYRDPSAWYHVVCAIDTTQATSSDRMKLYVNGSQITAFASSSYPTQNTDTFINANLATAIGVQVGTGIGNSYYLGGYLTEINFIDGQALTPSSFGRTSTTTGVWEPLAYTGTYGTNGFYVNFSDNSNTTAATLGKDYSGNGNNWTPNNFSVTAGVGNDSLVDSPTAYGTDTGVGGEVRGNYCTLNPLQNGGLTLSNGNLEGTSASGWFTTFATMGVSSGKWYWEGTCTSGGQALMGIATARATLASYVGVDTYGWCYYSSATDSYKINSGTTAVYGALYTTGDIISVALDLDAGTLVFYKNGVSQGTAYSSLSGEFFPAISTISNGIWRMNFGQRAFAYTAPSGFKALVTTNLPTPTIGATSTTQANDYFNAVLYTGNGSTQSITGVGFQPDWVWLKSRSNATDHELTDAVRGATKSLISNSTAAEATDTNGLTAFNSDGFSLGTDANYNGSARTFVSWNWNAGGSNATNTSGTITSTVRANTTSGFSIVTYTGTGANATVGHGLGVAPDMVIVKNRTSGTTDVWCVYHSSLGATQVIILNRTDATTTASTAWNNTAPTSSVFSIGTLADVNRSTNTYVAYCFDAVAGYSAFGSYTGNGSADGPFVYTNFRPEFVMIKNATTAGTSWEMFDNARETSNLMDLELLANSNAAEGTYTYGDFVSNGFKLRSTNNGVNQSSATLIYMAFAENPFKYALAR